MSTPSNRIPRYRKQKRSNGTAVAFVEIDGRRHYLGPYDSPASREAYARLLVEREASGGLLSAPAGEITVAELVAQFWVHAEGYYRKPDGTPSSELDNLRQALRPLVALYGSERVTTFGPRRLRAVQARMIALGWCRSHINKCVSRVRHVFKWGTADEICPASIYHALQAVPGLKRGRSEARESEPVRPVPETHVEAVRPNVSRQAWAMIRLQLLTGARAGELVGLRPIDLDTTERVWTHTPAEHKTAHRGHRRMILFGPRAQSVLRPFLADRAVDACLFDPREAERERHDKAESRRRPDQRPNAKKTDRMLGDRYTVASYRRAIHRACDLADVPRWGPHRLRHNAATRLRKEFGIELAQTVLGHRLGSAITEVYAEVNLTKAVEVLAEVG